MELATLERAIPGRLIGGIGHGVLPWMAQVGARVESPVTLLREYAEALRRLLDGETRHGRRPVRAARRGAQLGWPPQRQAAADDRRWRTGDPARSPSSSATALLLANTLTMDEVDARQPRSRRDGAAAGR